MLALKQENIVSSSEMRKDWSHQIDTASYEKPVFLKRNNNSLVLCSTATIRQMVQDLSIFVKQFEEEDGSVTLSLEAIDLVDNEKTFELAKEALIDDLIDYAYEYYQEYDLYSRAPNRKSHLPYVMKVLTAESRKELEDSLVCRPGEI